MPVDPIALGDTTTSALQVALRGLSTRQRALADNVANIETPGFRANRVEFESNLAAALAGGDPGSASVDRSVSTAPVGPNGNNVSLDEESVALIETGLSYQLAVEAMNAKFRLLRTAIRGQ